MGTSATAEVRKTQKLNVRVLEDRESIEAIRDFWERNQRHPNADIDFYLTLLRTRGSILRPHVTLVESEGQPRTLALGRVEETTLPFTMGYKTVFRPAVRQLSIIYGGIIGDSGEEIAEEIVSAVLDGLRSREYDLAYFSYLPAESAIVRIARRASPFLCGDGAIQRSLHWVLDLPPTMEEFYGQLSKKRRHGFRRLRRVLEKEFPGQVCMRSFRTPDEVADLCAAAERVACRSYHRGLNVGFVDNEENRLRYALAAERGNLCAHVLSIERVPAAFWIGTAYKGVCYLDFTGYNPDLSRFELGTILMLELMDGLCRDGRAARLDFGFGDAFYKRRICNRSFEETSFYIFAPTVRGRMLNALRTALFQFERVTEAVAATLGLRDRVKRLWRNLSRGSTGTDGRGE